LRSTFKITFTHYASGNVRTLLRVSVGELVCESLDAPPEHCEHRVSNTTEGNFT